MNLLKVYFGFSAAGLGPFVGPASTGDGGMSRAGDSSTVGSGGGPASSGDTTSNLISTGVSTTLSSVWEMIEYMRCSSISETKAFGVPTTNSPLRKSFPTVCFSQVS